MIIEDNDYCDDCRSYGDDYEYDKNGELVSVCDKCPHNPYSNENDE